MTPAQTAEPGQVAEQSSRRAQSGSRTRERDRRCNAVTGLRGETMPTESRIGAALDPEAQKRMDEVRERAAKNGGRP